MNKISFGIIIWKILPTQDTSFGAELCIDRIGATIAAWLWRTMFIYMSLNKSLK